MQFLFVFTICVAAASARMIGPISALDDQEQLKEIIAAINSPNTDPATAASLQDMLNELLGLNEHVPISVGPAIVDELTPISVGPAIVDEPASDASSPLVQIIVNVKSSSDVAAPQPIPVVVDDHVDDHVVDEIQAEPVVVVDQPADFEAEAVNVVELPDLNQPPAVGPISPVNVPEILN